jgi:prepilin-type N-terminal cleavage/methylation domain-containing protein
MPNRRGFTLVELMVAMVVLTIVAAAMYGVLINTQRVSRAQTEQIDMQANMRAGSLIVPAELREIGFDTTFVPGPGPVFQANAGSIAHVRSDILEMAPNRIRFRAVRGSGIICQVGASSVTVSLTQNASGYRMPTANDDVTIFVDRDVSTGVDDRWITRDITGVNTASNCPAGPWAGAAVLISVATFSGGANDPVNAADITVGSPVRITEIIEYSLYADADGRNYLGAQSISAGGGLQPVLGPLAPNGFSLQYLNSAGNVINCADPCSGTGVGSADLQAKRSVRAIRVSLASISDERVARAGGSTPQQLTDSVVTLVTLRNAVYR